MGSFDCILAIEPNGGTRGQGEGGGGEEVICGLRFSET